MSIARKLFELDQSQPKRIMVVGDGMTDVYVHGRTEACQEGCTKFMEQTRVIVSGGAQNAARSLSYWNSKVQCFSAIDWGAPIKTRFMDGDSIVFRHDEDRSGFDLEMVRKEALLAIETWRPDAVLLSDYDKCTLTTEFIRTIVDRCAAQGTPIVADAKRHPAIYAGSVLKCNESYYLRYADHFQLDTPLVVTHGQCNPIMFDHKTPWGIGRTFPPVQCVNHVGAGDCFAAHLTLALAHRLSLKEAAGIAHSAGRVYVQRRHNAPPGPEDVVKDWESGTA